MSTFRPQPAMLRWTALACLSVIVVGCEVEPLTDGYDGATVECTSCHGGLADNNAPPVPVAVGDTELAARGVGAHQTHLQASNLSREVSCTSCHKVPLSMDDPGHVDGLPAELTFGPLASHFDETTPVWDPESGRCSQVYCHGATLSAGALTDPEWQVTDGSQIACGACHGYPPLDPHPAGQVCMVCHPETVDLYGRVRARNGYHINGVIEQIYE